MSSHKSLALALCLAVTGCAQHPQKDGAADAGFNWWPFGSDQVVDKEVKEVVTEKVAKADAKSESASRWWWPFGDDAKGKTAAVPKIDHKATQAWLDSYEPKLREAIKDSKFEVERREDVLVVTVPVDSSYNPDRPAMLLPVTLGPITRVAKAVEADKQTAVLVLGHADTSGVAAANTKLSQERAGSVAAIFRLSGLERDRLMLRGMGSQMPRAANDSVEGRALNRRVELVLTPQNTMVALLAKYKQPTPSPAELVAVQDAKAPAKAAAKPAAKPAAKAPAKKATVAKKAAPAKAAAKKPAAKPAAKKAAAPAAKKVAANTSPAKTN
ncbi:OmpA family protein [Pseudomonas sp. NPDC087612]|uniref:OmpA family protein n=1 Tax=unclassified Pseudomonas TaxID=196821 RepID=UPI0005EB9B18|nr:MULTISPECIES: OmpA family protein [unclassified Pseudomonas]KJK17684.1 flagellar motor protein MotB [Pseudomonas sp. 2(2015)]QPG63319.1 OmpA family protein [Pseudomonas sp. BIGb0427]QVM97904.1 OmpA family protein [Pseudomonas sp. SORT22]UVL60503.1 OmpA family protein [Pseudomonas sp. B21-032]UVM65765.1 OmpA family protein [Pseudomonas sp. B21-009]